MLMVATFPSMPGISRSKAIRCTFNLMDITDEEYDMSHFRRYFDRYADDSIGKDFREFRGDVTRSLKEVYDAEFIDYVAGK